MRINAEFFCSHYLSPIQTKLKQYCSQLIHTFLEEKYRIPVWIENDGKCAALAEFWKGNLSCVDNSMVIGLGTEIT